MLELRTDVAAGGLAASQLLIQAAQAGYDAPAAGPDHPWFTVAAADRERYERALQAAATPRLALAAGASGLYKMWPLERFAELARRWREVTGGGCVLLPGPAEEALARALGELEPEILTTRGVGLTDLPAALAACRVLVGNSTGPVHVAAATGIPTVALHGCTDPAHHGPAGPQVTTLGGLRGGLTPGAEDRIRHIGVEEVLQAALRQAGWTGDDVSTRRGEAPPGPSPAP